jgi:hypothetical protein
MKRARIPVSLSFYLSRPYGSMQAFSFACFNFDGSALRLRRFSPRRNRYRTRRLQ